ncbi:sigma-70 family RNA polymerase sigma factor [Pontibacter sp. G13]|uniref:RNA polymerase sigma factor n=1 Tax=Pontibacter sp. G13 TaxID=3074898 RepID=UPI002889CAFC|nr:sigma-70 family RNA polymerase sigma factor [Pontibacter sp. G13]WNJ16014.1 sigma-70 family RNA polymerase sigma factor [Pontibacter sp. G13]
MLFRKRRNIQDWTDEELVEQYKSDGDEACMGELFQRYTHLVFLICMKYLKDPSESEDMSMRIFEKLMKDLKKYEVRTFKYWLHTVVRNQCLIHLDKQKRIREKREDFQRSEAEHVESAPVFDLLGEGDSKELQLQLMEQAITQLKDEQRVCVELFYLKQKSYQEVADETGYTLKQVKSYIQNGKRNLKILMTKMSANTSN